MSSLTTRPAAGLLLLHNGSKRCPSPHARTPFLKIKTVTGMRFLRRHLSDVLRIDREAKCGASRTGSSGRRRGTPAVGTFINARLPPEDANRRGPARPGETLSGPGIRRRGGESSRGRRVADWPKLRRTQAHAPALMRRRQPSSASVQPFCFTFTHRSVGPPSYKLASSLAT